MSFSPEQTEILLRARTGALGDNGDKMFYDLTFKRFVRISPQNKLYYYDKDSAARKAYELVSYAVKGRHVVEELPNYICEFNPRSQSGFYEKEGEKYFNLFEEPKAFALKVPAKHKSLDISFIEKYEHYNILLKNLFVKEEYLEYFINWLSTIINERIKTRTAIVLKGVEGTGKGLLQEQLIVPLFSEKYTTTMENEALRSQFNGELENKLFVIFNEIKGDFRESATLYEKLKIYISDSTININNKYGWAGAADNHFNCMFFSNNSLPVQISPTDRRYTVFNTSSTPLLEICEGMGITTDDFVAGLAKEREAFIQDLFAYNYNVARACKVLNTEEKVIIAESTTPKIQLVSNKLKTQDFKWLQERAAETFAAMKTDINGGFEAVINSLEEKFEAFLKDHLTEGYVTNEDLVTLYRIFVNFDETSPIKIANAWTPYLGKSKLKKMGAKPVRVRVVGSKKEWNTEELEAKPSKVETPAPLTPEEIAADIKGTGLVKEETEEPTGLTPEEAAAFEKFVEEEIWGGNPPSEEEEEEDYLPFETPPAKAKKAANPKKPLDWNKFDEIVDNAYGPHLVA